MAGKGMKPRVGYNYAKYAANWDHIKGFGKPKRTKPKPCPKQTKILTST